MKLIIILFCLFPLLAACNFKEGLKEAGDGVQEGVKNIGEAVKETPANVNEASNKVEADIKK